MKYYFIVNPNAGRGQGLKKWNRVKAFLDRNGLPYDIFFTTAAGDAARKARELSGACTEPFDLITVGGDGTMNEVLNGLNMQAPITLGYIPSGTGNDFARSMRINSNPVRVIRGFAKDRRVEALDYGVLTCGESGLVRRFINSTGTGYDAAVCGGLEKMRMKQGRNPVGKISYVLEGARQFILSRPSRGYVILDGDRRVEFNNILFISSHIHPFEGGGFRFASYADPKDGMLEICVVSGRNKLALIPVLCSGRWKGLKSRRGVRLFQCREAHIHVDRGLPVHTDGEILPFQTDLDVRCVQQQLHVLR
ncbi:MAG: YegS/Rv2252/BmrU family lipid kinase [Lachnospiraceae bacterium]|nr:YegS/Rv2252/BmrU family lipid kinase [Lachnospiraceae bacterium]MBQ2041431.1 YegS/Rv2252/BmrU family lipid kinase [Lachnospiraceae bacterium]